MSNLEDDSGADNKKFPNDSFLKSFLKLIELRHRTYTGAPGATASKSTQEKVLRK